MVAPVGFGFDPPPGFALPVFPLLPFTAAQPASPKQNTKNKRVCLARSKSVIRGVPTALMPKNAPGKRKQSGESQQAGPTYRIGATYFRRWAAFLRTARRGHA
jgi:hypothetical protein